MIFTSDKFTMFVGEEYHLTNYPKTKLTNTSKSPVQIQGKTYTGDYSVLYELNSKETKEVTITSNIIRLVSLDNTATVYVKSDTPAITPPSTNTDISDERINAIEQRITQLATLTQLQALEANLEDYVSDTELSNYIQELNTIKDLISNSKPTSYSADNNILLPNYINYNRQSNTIGLGVIYPAIMPNVGDEVTLSFIGLVGSGRTVTAYNTNTNHKLGEFGLVNNNGSNSVYSTTFKWSAPFNNEDSEILLRQSTGNTQTNIKYLKLEFGNKTTLHNDDLSIKVSLLSKELETIKSDLVKAKNITNQIDTINNKLSIKESIDAIISKVPYTGNATSTLSANIVRGELNAMTFGSNEQGYVRIPLQLNKVYEVYLHTSGYSDLITLVLSNESDLTNIPNTDSLSTQGGIVTNNYRSDGENHWKHTISYEYKEIEPDTANYDYVRKTHSVQSEHTTLTLGKSLSHTLCAADGVRLSVYDSPINIQHNTYYLYMFIDAAYFNARIFEYK